MQLDFVPDIETLQDALDLLQFHATWQDAGSQRPDPAVWARPFQATHDLILRAYREYGILPVGIYPTWGPEDLEIHWRSEPRGLIVSTRPDGLFSYDFTTRLDDACHDLDLLLDEEDDTIDPECPSYHYHDENDEPVSIESVLLLLDHLVNDAAF